MGLKPPWYPSHLSSRGVGSRRRRSCTQQERERPLSPVPRGLSAIHKRASNEVADVSPLSCSHRATAAGRRPADSAGKRQGAAPFSALHPAVISLFYHDLSFLKAGVGDDRFSTGRGVCRLNAACQLTDERHETLALSG
ncbi:unnamed protein product [Gadus morhua 'NCC']